jgi:LmbE family N-acetylglucosaminyl deacetylase
LRDGRVDAELWVPAGGNVNVIVNIARASTRPGRGTDNPPVPELLIFAPHPDDEAYAFGGLAALAAAAGWRVVVHAATSGENGKRHDGGPPGPEQIGPAREAEMTESCRLLDADPPVFWRLPDGGLRNRQPELIGRCDEALRAHSPQFVATLGRDGAYGHPDHIALHRAVEAVFGSAGEHTALLFPVFPKGLFLPQYEKCVAMMGDPPNPPPAVIGGGAWDVELDIRPVRDQKLAAIAAHRTQLPGDDPHAIFPTGIVDGLLEVERYALAGVATGAGLALLESLGREITRRS